MELVMSVSSIQYLYPTLLYSTLLLYCTVMLVLLVIFLRETFALQLLDFVTFPQDLLYRYSICSSVHSTSFLSPSSKYNSKYCF